MSAIRRTGRPALWVCLAIAASLAGCSRPPQAVPAQVVNPYLMQPRVITPIDVTGIDVGAAVNPDGTITKSSASFGSSDTVHAAVTTERPGHDIKLTARWLYQDGTVVKEETQNVSPSGTQITDFQASDDAGWPFGQYKLEIMVNGNRVAVTTFGVMH